jgi:DNA-binding LacI/PurR family transcriptional regulator
MKATIRSVAKLAGVAPSTVSHYLNQTAPLSAATAKSVAEAIAALNYRVNLGARNLRLRKTNSIGVVIPNITSPFFGEIAAIMENTLWERGFQTLLCISERSPERELSQVAHLVSRQVDGILLVYCSQKSRIADTLKQISVPIVFVDRRVPDQYSVSTDNFLGGRLAARHLAGLGHRVIGLLCGEPSVQNVAERIQGFQLELQSFGLEIPEAYKAKGRQDLQLGLRITDLLQLEPRPTAIFATNDIVAIGAWRKLVESGFRIPRDISIMGFDDIAISRFLVPPLTTVAQPYREIGAKAVELLVDLVQAEETTKPADKNVILAPTLKIRGSTAPLKKGGIDGRAIDGRLPQRINSVSQPKSSRPTTKGASRRPLKS